MVVGSRWVKREGCFGDYINERQLLGSSEDEKDQGEKYLIEKESQNLVIKEKEREL